ncbi:hypothetical protein KI387_018040, partial [Taxus chinensis]
ATPKLIREAMGVNGLRTSHVKSHLQMYRNMKKYENCQGPSQGNRNLDKFENRRKRSRYENGNTPHTNLDQNVKINLLPYSHKRLRTCEVQSNSLRDELSLEQVNSREQSTSYGNYINCSNSISAPMNLPHQQVQYQNDNGKIRNNKLHKTGPDNKKCCNNPKLNAEENGMGHLFEFICRPLQCTQKEEAHDQCIPSDLQSEDSLYRQCEKISSLRTSYQNRKPVSEQDEFSYSTSNDSQALLVLHINQFDNFGSAESKEQDGFKFEKKHIRREDDVRLELSLSIS